MLGLTLIPIVDKAQDSVEEMLLTVINGFVVDDYIPFLTVLAGMVIVLSLAWWMSKPRHRPKEERKMSSKTREARREYVKSRVSDAIVAAIEEAIYKHEITNDEAKWWYRKFGTSCELKDLLPKGPYKIAFPDKEVLKAQVTKRLGLNGKTAGEILKEKVQPPPKKTLKDILLSKRM